MFSITETKILISIFMTSAIMLSTAQVWSGGGFITTAFALYAMTGAVLYAMLTIVNYLARLAVKKCLAWRNSAH
jgi:hypothetical protein